MDITYLNISGTFYYLCLVLDGASRFLLHFDLREQMTELDVECILQRALELYPEARPRIISDNGPQFIAKDFKAFIRQTGMTHVRTSPYIHHYNEVRLHSALDYVAPKDALQGRAPQIWSERDRKLEAARQLRAQRRQETRAKSPTEAACT